MGTTGTIMGTSQYLKEQNEEVRIIGLQPKEGSAIAGIRRWPKEYLPSIFQVSLRILAAQTDIVSSPVPPHRQSPHPPIFPAHSSLQCQTAYVVCTPVASISHMPHAGQ